MLWTSFYVLMLLVLALTLVCLLVVGRIERAVGRIGMSVLTRVFGFLLTVLAAELILQGLAKKLGRG